MNEPTKDQNPPDTSANSEHAELPSAKPDPAAPIAKSARVDFGEFKQLNTLPGHTVFTFVGFAFVLFEMLFVCMYSDKFWFGVDIRWLGIPSVLLALVIAHFVLRWQEGPTGCLLFAPICHQKPPVVYWRWVRFNDPLFAPGIRFGNRHLVWDAIDELHLSIWGNLMIKSRRLSGPASQSAAGSSPVVLSITQPDVVLKLPFGVASPEHQRELVETIMKFQPNVVLNERLKKAIGATTTKADAGPSQAVNIEKLRQGTVIASLFGAVFLFVVLLDVGYSAFNYLQTLKDYYMCEVDADAGDLNRAQIDYDGAEDIRLHPLPCSWVTAKLMTQEPVGPALYQAKSEALWSMGKKNEAIEAATRALELAPKGFRHNLLLARMFTDVGRGQDAEAQIGKAIENHKGNFLSALYMVALKQGSPPDLTPSAKSAYEKYKAAIDDEVFDSNGPQWPPGGERFLHDIWYKNDVEYVFDRLIGPAKSKQ